MQTQRPWLRALLAISLVLNALALSRVGTLADRVEGLARELAEVASDLARMESEQRCLVAAGVTFGHGREALVPVNGFCCTEEKNK